MYTVWKRKDGTYCIIVNAEKNRTRAIVGRYDTYSQAQKAAEQLQKDDAENVQNDV